MEIKRNKSTKVIVIAIAILLCLALAVGITGAFYQAQRRATGTVKMDKGIVIDYTGFGKTPNEGTWLRETTISFKLFEDANVQPGEKISLLDAGIKANASSVDFYARVKLDYEFYNGETKLETLPASFKASDLITTSATFFGSDWVDSGAGDGYYYYATGTTLNKFTKATPATFVDLFDTNAMFIIEGANFTGAYPDGEGGGFVVGDTSINKIVAYLTLETLQGDVSVEELNTMGWKITEKQNSMELTSTDYTLTGSTYTPSNDYTLENPQYAFKFTIDDIAKTATITGLTADAWDGPFRVDLTIPSKILFKNEGGDEEYTVNEIALSGTKWMLYTIELPNTITNIASSSFYNATNLQEITIPNSVVQINYNTFYNCKNLKSINLSSNLTAINDSAFQACESLTTIEIPSSVTSIRNNAFNGCSQLSEISIPSGVTKIEYYTFSGCTNLNSVILPNTIQTIEQNAFSGCSSLTQIDIPESVVDIGSAAFRNSGLTSITIPDNVVTIGEHIFNSCTSLQSVIIGNGVTSGISNGMFSGCTSLKSVVIGDAVDWIGSSSFADLSNLETVKLGTSVQTIESSAFYNCSNLVSIEISDSIERIGEIGDLTNTINVLSVFKGCNNLQPSIVEDGIAYLGNKTNKYVVAWKLEDTTKTSYTIQNGCKIIYNAAFYPAYEANDENYLTNITSINLPNSIKSIGKYAFYGCSGLQAISISDTLKEIGCGAFYECSSLSTIAIPENVTNIYGSAFYNCSGLETITINSTLISAIDKYTFYGCTNLESFTIPTNIRSIGSYAFHGCSSLTEISMPNSVNDLGEHAFAECSNLQSVTLSLALTKIKEYSFYHCQNLQSINIPNNVTNIEEYAFMGCLALNKTIGDITPSGKKWAKASDTTFILNSTVLLNAIDYAIKKVTYINA